MKVVNWVFHSVLILALIAIPELASAQQSATPDQQQSAASDQQQPAEPTAQPANTATQENTAQGQTQPPANELPNSPGSVRTQAQQPRTESPQGTAVAEIGNASGTAASKPAGVAIAPAKQHQSRSLLIKVGAVLGVGVAIGTVMALSNASPSRPPGSQ